MQGWIIVLHTSLKSHNNAPHRSSFSFYYLCFIWVSNWSNVTTQSFSRTPSMRLLCQISLIMLKGKWLRLSLITEKQFYAQHVGHWWAYRPESNVFFILSPCPNCPITVLYNSQVHPALCTYRCYPLIQVPWIILFNIPSSLSFLSVYVPCHDPH